MRIKLDIPDKIHSKLLKEADREGVTANDLIVRSIQGMLKDETNPARKRKPPVIESKRPGSLRLDNAKIFELIDFP